MKLLSLLSAKLHKHFLSHGNVCDLCSTEVFNYPNERLCEKCYFTFKRNEGTVCPKCGRKTVSDGACLECKSHPPKYDIGVSPFTYEGLARKTILKYKSGAVYLAEFIGESMAKKFQEKFPNYQAENLFIVSVPMLEKDIKTRGFDHAKLIAEVVANRLEIPTLFGVLEKVKEDKEQKTLSKAEREQNLKGVYAVKDKKSLQGKNILLIDDTTTTGTTGNVLSALLKKHGANKVYFLTFSANAGKK